MTKDAVQARLLAERKARLLQDGEVYRLGFLQAKATVAHGLRPDALIHSTVEHAFDFVAGLAKLRLDAILAQHGGRFKALIPFVFAAFSYLSRKNLHKPVIISGLLVATVVAMIWRDKCTSNPLD